MHRPKLLLDILPLRQDNLFSVEQRDALGRRFEVVERGSQTRQSFFDAHLDAARYIVGSPPLDRCHLLRARGLRAVFGHAAQLAPDVVPQDLQRLGVRLLSTVPAYARSTGEMALGLALMLARGLDPAPPRASADAHSLCNRPLCARSLGIIGWNTTARGVLGKFHGLVDTIGISGEAVPDSVSELSGVSIVERDAALTRFDVLVMVEPPSSARHNALDARRLARLRDGTILIVLSGVDAVDRTALQAHCNTGRISAAFDLPHGLELDSDDPLRSTPNVLIPRQSSRRQPASLRAGGKAIFDDVALMEAEREPVNCEPMSPVDLREELRIDTAHQVPALRSGPCCCGGPRDLAANSSVADEPGVQAHATVNDQ